MQMRANACKCVQMLGRIMRIRYCYLCSLQIKYKNNVNIFKPLRLFHICIDLWCISFQTQENKRSRKEQQVSKQEARQFNWRAWASINISRITCQTIGECQYEMRKELLCIVYNCLLQVKCGVLLQCHRRIFYDFHFWNLAGITCAATQSYSKYLKCTTFKRRAQTQKQFRYVTIIMGAWTISYLDEGAYHI